MFCKNLVYVSVDCSIEITHIVQVIRGRTTNTAMIFGFMSLAYIPLASDDQACKKITKTKTRSSSKSLTLFSQNTIQVETSEIRLRKSQTRTDLFPGKYIFKSLYSRNRTDNLGVGRRKHLPTALVLHHVWLKNKHVPGKSYRDCVLL